LREREEVGMSPLVVLLILVAQAPRQAPPELPKAIDPLVAELLYLDRRDEALRQILERRVYRGPGKYTEDPGRLKESGRRIRRVVVCPQEQGPPIFAVFLGPVRDLRDRAQGGHFILIDADGAIVRVYLGANFLGPEDKFEDITGDGVVEMVQEVRHGVGGRKATVLHVVPIDRHQRAALRVAFRRSERPGAWSWRLRGSPDGPRRIEFGPELPGGEIAPEATYTWSAEDRTYGGPTGSPDGPFLRWEGEGREDLERFARVQP
jgi:hypothetical protein